MWIEDVKQQIQEIEIWSRNKNQTYGIKNKIKYERDNGMSRNWHMEGAGIAVKKKIFMKLLSGQCIWYKMDLRENVSFVLSSFFNGHS